MGQQEIGTDRQVGNSVSQGARGPKGRHIRGARVVRWIGVIFAS